MAVFSGRIAAAIRANPSQVRLELARLEAANVIIVHRRGQNGRPPVVSVDLDASAWDLGAWDRQHPRRLGGARRRATAPKISARPVETPEPVGSSQQVEDQAARSGVEHCFVCGSCEECFDEDDVDGPLYRCDDCDHAVSRAGSVDGSPTAARSAAGSGRRLRSTAAPNVVRANSPCGLWKTPDLLALRHRSRFSDLTTRCSSQQEPVGSLRATRCEEPTLLIDRDKPLRDFVSKMREADASRGVQISTNGKRCLFCGKPLPPAQALGRPRKFCSKRCGTEACRARQRLAKVSR